MPAANSDILVDQLTDEVRVLYAQDPSNAPQLIRALLESKLATYPVGEGKAVIQKMIKCFRPMQMEPGAADSEIMTRVFGLLLGRKVAPDDLSSTELLERLAESLNTIFDSLNDLISIINTSLSGGVSSGDQTIRQFIGFHLDGEDQTRSLEDYLGQINKAFLTTHEAFKAAAQTKVEQILRALDLDKIAAERSSGLKIGPMRKAEDFDILKGKIERIQRWFYSERFMDDFLREFEKNCQTFNQK